MCNDTYSCGSCRNLKVMSAKTQSTTGAFDVRLAFGNKHTGDGGGVGGGDSGGRSVARFNRSWSCLGLAEMVLRDCLANTLSCISC